MEQMTLSAYLRHAINEYLKKKSHSLITLSDKSGIHYNTLARILKGRVEQPSMETTLGILKICESRQKIGGTLARFFPDYSVVLDHTKEYGNMIPVIDGDQRDLFSDSLCARVLHTISSGTCAYIVDLRREFGEAGVKAVHRLLSANLVRSLEERLELNHEGISELGDQSALDLLSQSVKYMNEKNSGPIISQEISGVSEFGFDLIAQQLEETKDKIRKILEDDAFSGSKAIYLAYVFGAVDEANRPVANWLM